MRALSLREPWATMVLDFSKAIENRRKFNQFYPREPFLIHVAVGATRKEWDDAIRWTAARFPELEPQLPRFRTTRTGGIAGRARIVGVIRPHGDIQIALRDVAPGPMSDAQRDQFTALARARASGWHMNEQWGYVLADVVRTEFVPCRGMLGFFEVPAEIAAQAKALSLDTVEHNGFPTGAAT